MSKSKLVVVAGILGMAGCVTTSSIQPFGKDTYMVPTTLSESYDVKLANSYCAKRGLIMQPESIDIQFFVFHCVDAKHANAEGWGPASSHVAVTVKH
jgi:hypothetical protein